MGSLPIATPSHESSLHPDPTSKNVVEVPTETALVTFSAHLVTIWTLASSKLRSIPHPQADTCRIHATVSLQAYFKKNIHAALTQASLNKTSSTVFATETHCSLQPNKAVDSSVLQRRSQTSSQRGIFQPPLRRMSIISSRSRSSSRWRNYSSSCSLTFKNEYLSHFWSVQSTVVFSKPPSWTSHCDTHPTTKILLGLSEFPTSRVLLTSKRC